MKINNYYFKVFSYLTKNILFKIMTSLDPVL